MLQLAETRCLLVRQDAGLFVSSAVCGVPAARPTLRPTTTFHEEIFEASINDDGDVIIEDASRLRACVRGGARWLPVRVVARTPTWTAFRDDVLEYAANRGGTYAPVLHVDMLDVPSWHRYDRFEIIRKHMSPSSQTILDIGAHWGYMCEQFERIGKTCTAVEDDRWWLKFLTKLRRAQSLTYTVLPVSVFSLAEQNTDVVLALNVFHHFIKNRDQHAQLVELLGRLHFKEMFFSAHQTDEPQMADAYRNYRPEEFAAFVAKHAGATTVTDLGVCDGRNMYYLAM